jgi:hypothetical protein
LFDLNVYELFTSRIRNRGKFWSNYNPNEIDIICH